MSEGLTNTGDFVGTPIYSAPEQIGGAPIDGDVRADVYSLGVILFRSLTGQLPYRKHASLAQTLQAIELDEPLLPTSVCPTVGTEVEAILLKAISKNADGRYQSVDQFRDDIARYLDGLPIRACRPTRWYRISKYVSRHRAVTAIVLATSLLIIGSSIVSTSLAIRLADEKQRAVEAVGVANRTRVYLNQILAAAQPGRLGPSATATDLLADVAARVDRDLANDPLVLASIHSTLGETYFELLDYQRAERHLRSAVSTLRAYEGEKDEELATALRSLGGVLVNRGSPDSVPIQREALGMCESLRGVDSHACSRFAQSLAFALWRTQKRSSVDKAVAILEGIRDAQLQGETADHEALARCEYVLGGILVQRNQFGEAEAELRGCISATDSVDLESVSGAFLRGRCMYDLAGVLWRTGRVAEAEKMMRDALPHLERSQGDLFVPFSRGRLASLLLQLGRFEEAATSMHLAIAAGCAIADRGGDLPTEDLRALAISFANDPLSELRPTPYARAACLVLQNSDNDAPRQLQKVLELTEIITHCGSAEHARELLLQVSHIFEETLSEEPDLQAKASQLYLSLSGQTLPGS